MSECMQDICKARKPYPRTCAECGLGPCKRYPPQPTAYTAKESCVYHPTGELFLVVHPAQDSSKKVAAAIAELLNSDASLRYRIFGK